MQVLAVKMPDMKQTQQPSSMVEKDQEPSNWLKERRAALRQHRDAASEPEYAKRAADAINGLENTRRLIDEI